MTEEKQEQKVTGRFLLSLHNMGKRRPGEAERKQTPEK